MSRGSRSAKRWPRTRYALTIADTRLWSSVAARVSGPGANETRSLRSEPAEVSMPEIEGVATRPGDVRRPGEVMPAAVRRGGSGSSSRPSKYLRQASLTEAGFARYWRYSSSTRPWLTPKSWLMGGYFL
jgi:hypothetical protein